MPTYEYECQHCHERVEAVQKFSDAALTVCPLCGGELRKVFSAVGIVFKGSGFYKNDSRTSGSKSDSAGAASSTLPATTTESSTSSTPAPAPAAATPKAPAASSD
jgi:putative FmdB family regulatory protein